ncbi:DNA-binding response regulator, OmpR family, contains REC and winged-helix (wHTH) domain [Lachnospiraceae bacterium YSD2013]|nr:DNA-binding response regulator, OmpR family, contains REC and winged-helix (wHTH) domain [Lachnospiraceae bacterium YSD2013]
MSKVNQIIIVEDDADLNRGLCKALKEENRNIVSCESLKSAREQIELMSPALVLLDINLPDGNGLTLLKEIKESRPETGVLLLSANDTDADVVKGLEMGADDYVTKPFSLSVLRARVNTRLRSAGSNDSKERIVTGIYDFDFEKMIYKVRDAEVSLSKIEQKLLKILVSNKGITQERGKLVDRLWTDGAEYVDENALSVTVKRLRDKLDDKDRIKTVYGIGYVWVKDDE